MPGFKEHYTRYHFSSFFLDFDRSNRLHIKEDFVDAHLDVGHRKSAFQPLVHLECDEADTDMCLDFFRLFEIQVSSPANKSYFCALANSMHSL